jgi:hypothetical protein
LGVPLLLWGAACLVIAVIFAFVWPSGAGDLVGLRYLLVRWGHALVWLLLAAFCFARGARLPGPINVLGVAAGLVYLVFLVSTIRK